MVRINSNYMKLVNAMFVLGTLPRKLVAPQIDLQVKAHRPREIYK